MVAFHITVNGSRFHIQGRFPDGFSVWASLHDGIHHAKEGYWSCPLYLLPEFLHVFRKHIDDKVRTDIEHRLSIGYLMEPERTFPSFIVPSLLPHQKEGVRFILNRTRCFELDQMGAMKTLQLLEASLELLRLKRIDRVMVVVTSSGQATWLDELRKWGFDEATGLWKIPEAEKHTLLSAPYATIPAKIQGDYNFLISSFNLFSRDPSDEYVRAILDDARHRRYFIIVDEAHRIGNALTNTAKNLMRFNAQWRVAMTGTPIGNRAEEVFALQSFLEGGEAWGGYDRFASQFLVKQPRSLPNGKMVYHTVGYRNLDRLGASLVPISIRRLKQDLAPDMPPIVPEVRRVALSDAETEVYAILRKQFETEVENFHRGSIRAKDLEMGAYSVCKQFLAHPRLLAYSESKTAKEIYNSHIEGREFPASKFQEMMELAEDIMTGGEERAVVFCDSPRLLHWIGEKLPMGSWVGIDGETPQSDRRTAQDRFNSDPTCRFFLSSDAGTESLNLPADYAIHYTLPWSLTKLNQRTERCHRLNVKRMVTSIRIIAETEDSMDHVIEGILEKKAGLAAELLEDVEKASIVTSH